MAFETNGSKGMYFQGVDERFQHAGSNNLHVFDQHRLLTRCSQRPIDLVTPQSASVLLSWHVQAVTYIAEESSEEEAEGGGGAKRDVGMRSDDQLARTQGFRDKEDAQTRTTVLSSL